MKILFATQNQHKRDEVQALVGHHFNILSLHDFHFTAELPETHETLQENALEKALFVHQQFLIDCFSEDTGLEIDALGGAPGVYSARYAGEGKKPRSRRRPPSRPGRRTRRSPRRSRRSGEARLGRSASQRAVAQVLPDVADLAEVIRLVEREEREQVGHRLRAGE